MEKKTLKRKAGRTLLINNDSVDVELNYEGIISTHKTKSGARFVIFDSVEKASNVYNDLINKNVKVKYSYYKIFYRLSEHNLDENLNYDELKTQICDKLNKLIGSINILYFKFYTKNNRLIGSGDFTIDTKETFDALIALKEMNLGSTNINFYHYRAKRQNVVNRNVD